MSNSILVTGGAGYIGSHVVRQLVETGHTVIVVDDLSKGFQEAVIGGQLVVGDFADQALIEPLFDKYAVDAVMHFAAHTIVPESVLEPLKYYHNNTIKTHQLISSCIAKGVENFIFSSTAAVYGLPDSGVADEESSTAPINPYGTSKLMAEWMLRDISAATKLRHVTLRYFNVAGSEPRGRIGQSTPGATLLIKVACEVAVGKRDVLTIYGTDYPTADGTGVRDYIHVEDLAHAHVKALTYLEDSGQSITLNCGYGRGYSVREVINAVERVTGQHINTREAKRRLGDPPTLIAQADRIKNALGWSARFDDLDTIVEDSLNWERNTRY